MKRILVVLALTLVVVIGYFSLNMYDFAKGVKTDALNNEFVLKNERWINNKDATNVIAISGDKWMITTNGSTKKYQYKTTTGNSIFSDSQPNTGRFVTLMSDTDTLRYEIIEFSETTLKLYNLDNKNIVVYYTEYWSLFYSNE